MGRERWNVQLLRETAASFNWMRGSDLGAAAGKHSPSTPWPGAPLTASRSSHSSRSSQTSSRTSETTMNFRERERESERVL